jgi:hypothetical protein
MISRRRNFFGRNKTYEENVAVDVLAAAADRLKRSEAGTA